MEGVMVMVIAEAGGGRRSGGKARGGDGKERDGKERDGDEEGKLERKRVVTKKAEARTRNKGFMKVRRGTCLALS